MYNRRQISRAQHFGDTGRNLFCARKMSYLCRGGYGTVRKMLHGIA
jgi:hypothetical protein